LIILEKLTIAQIKQRIDQHMIDTHLLNKLKKDKRKGVQKLVKLVEKRQEIEKKQKEQFHRLLQFDQQFRTAEHYLVAGVDEAGRGPLAGPVVAAAVILPDDLCLVGMNDSKQLTEKERINFYDLITAKAISYQITVVHNDAIDEMNIYEATKTAMIKALAQLHISPHIALIDAMPIHSLPYKTKSVIKGDMKSLSIAAASVLAKVKRDEIMKKIDKAYPQYHFAKNKGYGTKEHLDSLEQYGCTPYHRKTFSPVHKYM